MWDTFNGSDPLSRRTLLEYAAKSMLGVSILHHPLLAAGADAKAKPADVAAPKATAKNVIYLFMTGAMSHIDTFDPKPGRETGGETTAISTKATGVQIGNHLPKLAQIADRLAIVRSITTETGDHEQGKYLMRTAYKEIASIRHPGMGAWAMKMLPSRTKTLPDNVVIGGESRHPGAGFLEPTFTPVPVADASAGLQNTKAPQYLTEDSFERRMGLINKFDASFRKKYPQKQVEAYSDFYRQANTLMQSDDLKAFDLNQEKPELRDKYGRDRFGQGCLLARRLVEQDVRFVEVNFGGWDLHVDLYTKITDLAATLDRAVSALLDDLKEKGLLDSTLVVLTTEFGRSPKINQNAGRDHHPGVFSGLFAGGGIKGGVAYGTSDKDGHGPDKDRVNVADMNATIAHALGIPLKKEVFSSSGRPFKVAHDGVALTKLFG